MRQLSIVFAVLIVVVAVDTAWSQVPDWIDSPDEGKHPLWVSV